MTPQYPSGKEERFMSRAMLRMLLLLPLASLALMPIALAQSNLVSEQSQSRLQHHANFIQAPRKGRVDPDRSSVSIPKRLRGKIAFRDTLDKQSTLRHKIRPWDDAERRLVIATFVRASELAPALLERATAYKPITLYRAGEFRSFTAASAPAYFKGPLSEMIFNHWFFESHMMLVFNQKVDNRLQALIHEVTHLADPAHKISQSKAWRTLANSTIRERYRLPFKLRQVPDAIAWEAGLPSSYAATNDVEALAEYCAALVLMHDKSKVNPEIKQFIQAKLLQLPSEPDQSIPDCYEAWQLVRKRDLSALRQAKQLFEKALKYDPDYLEAFWGKQFVDMRIADQATGESR